MNVGVKRVQAGGKGQVDIYDVTELIGERKSTPITRFTGNSLTILAGIVPPLGTGARLLQASQIQACVPMKTRSINV